MVMDTDGMNDGMDGYGYGYGWWSMAGVTFLLRLPRAGAIVL